MRVVGHCHVPDTLPSGKRPGIHCTVGCMAPRAGLDGYGKILPPYLGSNPVGQCHVPDNLPSGKRPGIHCTVGCMGPRAGLDG